MRNVFKNLPITMILITIFIFTSVSTALSKEVSLVTKDELKSMLNDTDVVILDVRGGRDWSSSEFKIQGAVHADPKKVSDWKGAYSKDAKIVLYCA